MEALLKYKIKILNIKFSYRNIATDIKNISASSLSQYVNGNSEIDFSTAYSIVKKYFPNEEKDIMTDYILTLEKPENLRLAMEYASFNDFNDLQEYLVNKELQSQNKTNKEWANLYNIELQFKKKIDIFNDIRFLKINDNDLFFMRQWLEAKWFYNRKEYKHSYCLLNDARELILNVKNDFLQQFYTSRLDLALSNLYLNLGYVNESRELALNVINKNLSYKKTGHAQHPLGYTYFFESYDKSLDCLLRSKSIFQELNEFEEVINVNRTIVFLQNYWNKDTEVNTESIHILDIHEVIHKEIKKGNFKKSQEMLMQININNLDYKNKGYHYYYMGLAFDDIDYLYKSIMFFKEIGSIFFTQLASIELLKRGERKSAIEAAIGINKLGEEVK